MSSKDVGGGGGGGFDELPTWTFPGHQLLACFTIIRSTCILEVELSLGQLVPDFLSETSGYPRATAATSSPTAKRRQSLLAVLGVLSAVPTLPDGQPVVEVLFSGYRLLGLHQSDHISQAHELLLAILARMLTCCKARAVKADVWLCRSD
jgi:hypothetical protein